MVELSLTPAEADLVMDAIAHSIFDWRPHPSEAGLQKIADTIRESLARPWAKRWRPLRDGGVMIMHQCPRCDRWVDGEFVASPGGMFRNDEVPSVPITSCPDCDTP